ncbi:MAG TPA: YciI family protein [Rugosimonospora sp.]|nr:YciI family protein [Rugosimonospora sp.]
MAQYLLTVYQPDGDPPPPEILEPIMRGVQAWEGELKDAGAWVFTAGLYPADTATVARLRDGEVLLTDGPFTEGKEHVGGFTVLDAPDLDAALHWARRLTEITMLPIEVRPVLGQT